MGCRLVIEQPGTMKNVRRGPEGAARREEPFTAYGLQRSQMTARSLARANQPSRVVLVCDQGTSTILADCTKSRCTYAPRALAGGGRSFDDDWAVELRGRSRKSVMKHRKRAAKKRPRRKR